MRRTSASLKASIVTERTKEMCTPRERWMPEQARQKKMPNLGEAWKVVALVSDGLLKHVACHSAESILAARNIAVLLVTTYPLWTGSTTVDAAIVLVCLCDLAQLGASLRIDFPHFTHLGCVAWVLLNTVCMQRRGVLWARERSSLDGGEKRRLGCLGVVVCCCLLVLLLCCHVLCL